MKKNFSIGMLLVAVALIGSPIYAAQETPKGDAAAQNSGKKTTGDKTPPAPVAPGFVAKVRGNCGKAATFTKDQTIAGFTAIAGLAKVAVASHASWSINPKNIFTKENFPTWCQRLVIGYLVCKATRVACSKYKNYKAHAKTQEVDEQEEEQA